MEFNQETNRSVIWMAAVHAAEMSRTSGSVGKQVEGEKQMEDNIEDDGQYRLMLINSEANSSGSNSLVNVLRTAA